jgi:predicted ATPase
MYVRELRVRNYKCFADTGTLLLSPTFNIALGQNDVGKSALLEAATLTVQSKPHRSLTTAKYPSAVLDPASVIDCEFVISGQEVEQWLAPLPQVLFPLPPALVADRADEAIAALCSQSQVVVRAQWSNGALVSWAWFPEIGGHPQGSSAHLAYGNEGVPTTFRPVRGGGGTGTRLADHLAETARQRIFAMRAERLKVGESATAGRAQMLSDAANLPEVLNVLQTARPKAFQRLMEYVRRIFPHVTEIRSPTVEGSTSVKIVVDTTNAGEDRPDLAVHLSESGTGIGQVLAILYAIVSTSDRRLVIVDEPQSFLHPGAVRKLLEVMRENSQHQYLVSTHAPIALNDEPPDNVLVVTRRGTSSTVTRVASTDQTAMRAMLAELGARPSDVLGADSILWVEGRTEEVCFPRLIREVAGTPLIGSVVLGVVSTDEVTGRQAGRVVEIYAKLSNAGNVLMPPARGFVFDREGRNDKVRADLDRDSGGKIFWLPRRMFENYLIEPNAIAHVLATVGETDVSPERVLEWIAECGKEPKFLASNVVPLTEPWLARVHGAKLLKGHVL